KVTGTVLDPDGKPMAGAKVCWIEWLNGQVVRELATSDAEGKFSGSISSQNPDQHNIQVFATKDGFGIDGQYIHMLHSPEVVDLKLKLVADVPVTGRIVDAQGKPFANVTVSVVGVTIDKNAKFDELLEVLKKNPDMVLFGFRQEGDVSLGGFP